jgi:hypothetical protein
MLALGTWNKAFIPRSKFSYASGRSPYSGCFIKMDALQQLILLARKIERSLGELVRSQKDSIGKDAHTEKGPGQSHEPFEINVRSEVEIPERAIQQYQSDQDKSYRLQRASFVVNCLTLVALCVYAVYTIKIAHANKQSADAATVASQAATDSLNETRKQFQLDQRPYISIVGFALSDIKTRKSTPPVIGKPLVVTISFRNTGKSQAINTLIHRHLLFGSHLNDFRIEPADTNRVGNTVDPGAKPQFTQAVSVRDTFQSESFRYDPKDIIDWDGSKPIIVFGRISYEDTFGNVYCLPYAVSPLESGSWLDIDNWGGHGIRELCPIGKP